MNLHCELKSKMMNYILRSVNIYVENDMLNDHLCKKRKKKIAAYLN